MLHSALQHYEVNYTCIVAVNIKLNFLHDTCCDSCPTIQLCYNSIMVNCISSQTQFIALQSEISRMSGKCMHFIKLHIYTNSLLLHPIVCQLKIFTVGLT